MRAPEDFDGAFLEIARLRPDGLLVQPDVLIVAQRSRVVDLAAKKRSPAVSPATSTSQGRETWRTPGEQPWKFDVVIDLKTAKALGLTISQSLLLRADQIIE